MLLRLAYLGVTNALAMLRLLPMSDRAKDAEILALRQRPWLGNQFMIRNIASGCELVSHCLGDQVSSSRPDGQNPPDVRVRWQVTKAGGRRRRPPAFS